MRSLTFAVVVIALAPGLAFAQDIPLSNWTVPPYRAAEASGGYSTMVDISPGVGFVAMQPCRLVDTRGGGVFTGAYGPPNMAAGQTRTFDLDSAPHCTGIPAGVEAYSLNFTVTLTAGAPGDIRAWPTGSPPVQLTSVLNWTASGATLANATIIPAGTNGAIDVQVAGSGTHLLIDINGYFTDEYNPGTAFFASSVAGPAIFASNSSSADGTAALVAQATAATGRTRGIYGATFSPFSGSAGVFGVDGSGTVAGETDTVTLPAGVLGESNQYYGVVGLIGPNGFGAVTGRIVDGPYAVLGDLGGPAELALYASGDADVAGTLTANTKMFVEPHPLDASKEIRYVSLEGPRSEVYFRGTAQVSLGVTRIPIPEEFRLVASRDTYSTLVTPVGGMATVAVISEGEDGIIVQASRNVKVHYVVYAEREAFRQESAIIDNVHFRGESEDRMRYLPDSYRRRMIRNGTLNPDGSVNVETARRLGWEKEREKRSRPAPEPVSD